MASMNWLGFSLSPQELPSQQAQQDLSNTDVTSASDCYDMGSGSAAPPSLNLPPSFGMLEAFHRENQSQDWNLKDAMGMNSMLMGTNNSTCNQEPKLENFLDSNHSFGEASSYNDHGNTNGGDYSFSNCALQLPFNPSTNNLLTNPRDSTTSSAIDHNNQGINVSMIKTWLRNQPSSGNKNEVPGVEAGGALTNAQTLSLSMMSGGPETALPLALLAAGSESKDSLQENDSSSKVQDDGNGVSPGGGDVQSGAIIEAVPRKSIDTFGQRTSIYRGVTRHRWTGRYEAHLWDNSCRREGQTRKGRQVYLGGYDKEEKAARSYDLAAIKYWGTTTTTNFPISNYEKEVEEMKHMTRQEYVASLRRKSSGFSRGASIYRGVTRHHQHGRWQARIGRVAGNKDLYLGTFSTQEEAAEAYDIAAIKFRGLNAVTNFEINRYDVKAILESSALPIGGAGKRMKEVEDLTGSDRHRLALVEKNVGTHLPAGAISLAGYHTGWPAIAFQQAHQPLTTMQQQHQQQQQQQQQYHQYSQQQQRLAAWCKQEQESGSSNNAGGFQDVHQQLQLGNNNTHNFFHHNSYNNLMGIDSGSMEQGSETNSVMYGGDGGNGGGGYGGNSNGGFLMQMGSVESGSDQMNNGSGNMYYHQQGNESWIPTAVPTLAPRTANNMAVCHGATPTFTVWNDA